MDILAYLWAVRAELQAVRVELQAVRVELQRDVAYSLGSRIIALDRTSGGPPRAPPLRYAPRRAELDVGAP
jgi:hypothetical protein